MANESKPAVTTTDAAGNQVPVAKPYAETAPSNIPRVTESVTLGGAAPTPPDEKFTDGSGKYKRKSDGEEYALAIVDETPFSNRTHRAKNTLHYWEGSAAQFTEAFTELDGSPVKPIKQSAAKPDKGGGSAGASDDDQVALDDMTVPELKEEAARKNVDITGLTLKDDILAAIKDKSRHAGQ